MMSQKDDIKNVLASGGITLTEDLKSQATETKISKPIYKAPVKPSIAIIFVLLAILSLFGGVAGALYYSNVVIFISGLISACIFWGIYWIIVKIDLIEHKIDVIINKK